MRLETIILINRAPFERIQLQLENENVFILSGINGTGKTTILSYIVDAFYELARNSFQNEFENKQNKYYRVSSGLYSLDNTKASIVYMRFKMDEGTNRDYIDIRGNCDQEEYEKLIGLKDKIQYGDFSNTLVEAGNVKHWSLSDRKSVQEVFDKYILTYFPAYRYEMPSYMNDPYKIAIPYTTAMHFSGYLNNPIEVTSDLSSIANWIMDVVLDLKVYPEATNVLFEQINDVISNILFSKIKKLTRIGIGPRSTGAQRIAIMGRNDDVQVYPSIFNMSSGELALLCLFGELVRQADKNKKAISRVKGIVLVDEIEKHLHIRLQKETLPRLIKLFPNIQFIVSSHSPFFSLGVQEERNISYTLVNLGKNGIRCLPHETEIYKEVYNIMVSQNDRFADKYEELLTRVTENTKPIIITEGKTDWKHLKAAMRELDINDINLDFYEFEDTLGDSTLQELLTEYTRITPARTVIGVFDRDNPVLLTNMGINSVPYKCIGKNIYAFAIPLVHEMEYGTAISIEHYYKREDLCRTDENQRRLFLGDEFYNSGNSKDGKYQTKIKQIQNKTAINGVIDDKVYSSSDLEQAHSLAMSKECFAKRIYEKDSFAEGFDFSCFERIFDIIRAILNETDTSNQ